MQFDDYLKSVGEFGRFQKLTFLALAVLPILHGMQSTVTNFIGPSYEHWCEVSLDSPVKFIPNISDTTSLCLDYDIYIRHQCSVDISIFNQLNDHRIALCVFGHL